MKRVIVIVLVVIAALGAALPFAPVAFLKGPMQRALSRGLGRKVEIDSVSLTLFSGPGFSLSGVTIHEDPRVGIEPFAYANALDATLDPLALLGGSLEFSSLHFNDATINLVKPNDEVWNFQMLLDTSPGIPMPSLKMRGGRINFKFGDTKAVVFFDDTDLDVSSHENGAVELRFSGAPARTDRSLQGFGHFFVRGTSVPGGQSGKTQLSYRVELEPSSLDSVARLFTTNGPDLKGTASFDAQISGSPQHLDVKGLAQFGDGGRLRLDYRGVLDLTGHTLELVSLLPQELHTSLRLSANSLLSAPQWDVAAEMNAMPLDALLNIARRVGAPVPAGQGTVSGNPGYSSAAGFSGNVEVREAAVSTMKIPTATVFLKKDTILAGPVTVHFDEADTAEVQATYQSGDGGGMEWKVSTRRMGIANIRAFGLASAPMLDRVSGGSWRGLLRYQQPASGAGSWSGDFDVQDVQVRVDGLAAPVDLQAATVSAKPERVALTRIRSKAGGISFSGDYGWAADAAEPQRFRLQAAKADLVEVERLFAPTLARSGGVLSRTLGLGSAPAAPEWLANRKAEGTVTFDGLSLGGVVFSGATRLAWTGTSVTFTTTSAKIAEAGVSGELRVDLSAAAPRYQYTGTVKDVRYKGGVLDFDGKADAEGSGAALAASLKAEGSFQGRSIMNPPDAEYRRAKGRFSVHVTPGGAEWNAFDLEVQQGKDTFIGEASRQADGKLTVKLNRGQ